MQNVKTFKDVKGCDDAKQELEEVVEYLKNPGKFTRLGGKLPKVCLIFFNYCWNSFYCLEIFSFLSYFAMETATVVSVSDYRWIFGHMVLFLVLLF